jgi:hypothetical protein
VENLTALEGPVLKVNGELLLLIPLTNGSTDLAKRCRGISEVSGEFLKIVIPDWLAGILEIEEGDLLRVESDGILRITAPTSPLRVH